MQLENNTSGPLVCGQGYGDLTKSENTRVTSRLEPAVPATPAYGLHKCLHTILIQECCGEKCVKVCSGSRASAARVWHFMLRLCGVSPSTKP